jgi:hypothetical protein
MKSFMLMARATALQRSRSLEWTWVDWWVGRWVVGGILVIRSGRCTFICHLTRYMKPPPPQPPDLPKRPAPPPPPPAQTPPGFRSRPA